MLMFGDAMSILARSTWAPSANSPARMRANRSRLSSTGRSRIRAFPAGLGQRAAVLADLLGAEAVDVGLAGLDQVHGVVVERLEIVRRVARLAVPLEAQPAHVLLDRLDVLDVLFRGVGVVEAQVADAAELGGDAEVEADRLGVADVQVAVGLRGKTRGHTSGVLPRADVLSHYGPDEIERGICLAHGSCCSRVAAHKGKTSILRMIRSIPAGS